MTEESFLGFVANDAKRVLQWLLGCTYSKKSITARIQEMFHFSEAPHVVVVEKFEGRSWWSTTGVILGVLICVLTVYYIAESIIRSVKRFLKNALQEPQGTITTPTVLSPAGSQERIHNLIPERELSTKTSISKSRSASKKRVGKIHMNEPVNCVFVRPSSPSSSKLSVPSINTNALKSVDHQSEESVDPLASPPDENDLRPVNGSPALKKQSWKSPAHSESSEVGKKSDPKRIVEVKNEDRPASGADVVKVPPCFEFANLADGSSGFVEWLQKQILETDSEDSLPLPSTSDQFLKQIQKLLDSEEDPIMAETQNDVSFEENISEMSPVSMSIQSPDPNQESINLRTIDSDDGNWSRAQFSPLTDEEESSSEYEQIARENTNVTDDIDVVIDDNYMFADSRNESFGKVLLKEGQSKVVFRWTDAEEDTVDTVTITGSFFGWKMKLPMRRNSVDRRRFSVCIELPPGLHSYKIQVFRFDL